MKRHIFKMTLVAGGMALAMLSACHRSNNRNTGMEGTSSVTQVNSENIQPERLDNWADLRRPDVKIHVKRGQTLAMQTEGLRLTAIDAAVQHEADYSVTSLVKEELPPLPQGMMNMKPPQRATACCLEANISCHTRNCEWPTTLSVCPKAIRPTTSTPLSTTPQPWRGCVWSVSRLTPSITKSCR